jgi:hypothetical protein
MSETCDQALTRARPWDQLPDEPVASYRRFLVYRDLGFKRSLLAAYRIWFSRRGKGDRVPQYPPGQWIREAARFRWRERACQWDIYWLNRISRRKARARERKLGRWPPLQPSRFGKASEGSQRQEKVAGRRFQATDLGKPGPQQDGSTGAQRGH